MELHGAFKIEGHTMGGTLHASAEKIFSVKAVGFSDCDALNDVGFGNHRRIPLIHFVADDLRKSTCVEPTLQPIWGTSGSAVNGLTYSIVEGGHFNEEKVFDGAVADFNLWPEFCHAQGFSKSAEMKDDVSISVRDGLNITCCENMMQALCGDASFSNRISFGEELDEELQGEIRAIFEKAKQAHNKENILVMHKTEHQWFLRFERETKLCGLEDMENLIRSFADLLFVLTYKPSTPIACDLYTQNNDTRYKTYYPWRFPISGNKSSFSSGEKFIHQMAPITLPKLGGKWPSVVQSWYEKRSKLSPYINILRANQMEQVSDFKYTRCIDALAMIGVEIGGTRKNKYQYAVSQLDKTNLKDYLMTVA
ncbi:hypothetical protein P4E94_05270 [Pontiellaceae bacterium B12219]|nr:hypothetical protein [Pontiellaceae bacterium B12219]